MTSLDIEPRYRPAWQPGLPRDDEKVPILGPGQNNTKPGYRDIDVINTSRIHRNDIRMSLNLSTLLLESPKHPNYVSHV